MSCLCVRSFLCGASTRSRAFRNHRSPLLYARSTLSTTTPVVHGTLPFGAQGVAVGQWAQLERSFTPEDVAQFGRLIGDFNPLHSSNDTKNDDELHPLQHPDKVLVHGMLVMSIISRIFGTQVPGSVYLKQTMNFRHPVFCDEQVVGKCIVTSVRRGPRQQQQRSLVVTCDTIVEKQRLGSSCTTKNDDDDDCNDQTEKDKSVLCVQGEAQVLVLGGFVLPNDND